MKCIIKLLVAFEDRKEKDGHSHCAYYVSRRLRPQLADQPVGHPGEWGVRCGAMPRWGAGVAGPPGTSITLKTDIPPPTPECELPALTTFTDTAIQASYVSEFYVYGACSIQIHTCFRPTCMVNYTSTWCNTYTAPQHYFNTYMMLGYASPKRTLHSSMRIWHVRTQHFLPYAHVKRTRNLHNSVSLTHLSYKHFLFAWRSLETGLCMSSLQAVHLHYTFVSLSFAYILEVAE